MTARPIQEVRDQIERLEFVSAVTEGEMAYNVVRGWIAALRWALGREDMADRPEGADRRDAIAANLAALSSLSPGDRIVADRSNYTAYAFPTTPGVVTHVTMPTGGMVYLNDLMPLLKDAIKGGAVVRSYTGGGQ